jgi:thiol-disulfide isomerase/thioredoxin
MIRVSVAALVCLFFTGAQAGVLLEPVETPEWQVSEWLNGDPGRIADHKGQVVLIHFFQLWCPGCNEFTLPLLQEWEETFAERDDLLIVSIHTVFEGHDEQTPDRLRRFIAEKNIAHPVGIDAYERPGDEVPITMDRFETGGTPHVVIVDKKGKTRFTHFGAFDRGPVERFLNRLLDEKQNPLNLKTVPRGTRDKPSRKPRSEPKQEEPEPAPEEPKRGPKGQPDPELSGTYKLIIEQTSKSCGETNPPMEVIAEVKVYEDTVEARFTRPFLGMRQVTAEYSPGSGTFDVNQDQTAKEKGTPVEVSLEASGQFVDLDGTPMVEFDFVLDKRGEDPESDCDFTGHGSGSRIRGR